MKTFFCQLALLLGLGLLTQTANAQTAADEQAIRNFIDNGLKAYFAADVETLVNLYAENAAAIDFTGRVDVGRQTMRANLTEHFKVEKPDPNSFQLKVSSIRFLDANTAIVLCDLSGTAKMGDQTIQWTAVESMLLSRKSGSWLIELDQTTPLMPPPAEGN